MVDRGLMIPLIVLFSLSLSGCINGAKTEVSGELADHGIALSKNRTYAFVVHTSDDQEKNFGDEDLLAAMPVLRRMQNVRTLDISGTTVTDRSVAQLRSLPHIQEVNVIGTAVTRDGLMELSEMPRLHFLLVDGERLSEADLETIQGALPDVELLVKKRLGPIYPFIDRPSKYRRVPPA